MDRVSLQAWSALWRRLGARSDPEPAHGEIQRAYSEPHRHYHTLEHIARVLSLFDGVRSRVREADAAELALWLHDFVYDPRAKDNEERSAGYAKRILGEGGVRPEVGEQVTALIMATCHASLPEAPDACYVVDADLSILGGSPAEFDRYEVQVREEYEFVSESDWRTGRTRILGVFLDRPRIFLTPEFASLEAPARANLKRSLQRLRRAPVAATRALTEVCGAASVADAMRFEVDLIQEEGGLYRATAVAYPTVTVTGRTEKEALGLLIDALDRHFKDEARKSQTRS